MLEHNFSVSLWIGLTVTFDLDSNITRTLLNFSSLTMDDLRKVNSLQLYSLWRNLTIGLVTVVLMFALSKLLPGYMSPVVSLLCAAGLYTFLYNQRMEKSTSCALVPYVIFYCLIVYSFVSIIINVIFVWGVLQFDAEFIFFNDPYVPSLLMVPVSFLVCTGFYVRRNRLKFCTECRFRNGSAAERGMYGQILSDESKLQIKNLMILFGFLSFIIWSYYLFIYVKITPNARDWYVFTWLTIIAFVIDEVYFIFRYYNLYLDLKENEELVDEEDLSDMTAKTYVRFYLICGNNIFLNPHAISPTDTHREVLDTPFVTRRTVNGVSVPEVKRMIERMTDLPDGELKFFYGRKLPDLERHSLLRYFYFLEGDVADYQHIDVEGEWIDFERLKQVYSHNPGTLSRLLVNDITRLATIILTEKIFDENGIRKNPIKSYTPSFNLIDVRESELDFQDDKWIRISLFNSDTRMFKLKKWWRGLRGKDNSKRSWR